MNPQVHDTGRKLQFNSRHHHPVFRHPYEKYNSRTSNDSIFAFSNSAKRNISKRRKAKDVTGLQDKNIYICQTFLKENPFFGAYFPDGKSEIGEGTSGRGSERTRSCSTDFDDSRTYRVFHSEESNGNEDRNSVTRCKFKKADDIHHFHEHHHFFHEKEVKPGKESNANPLIDSNKSFLKQPIQESCMFYEKGETRKSFDGPRGASRCSSKTGRKSSDNETYTVVCEYCQKLLRDYPNARVVGHENIPARPSSEVTDRRPYCYNGESMVKKNWTAANTFIAEPIQGPRLSQESSRMRKSDKQSKISDESGSPTVGTLPSGEKKSGYMEKIERGAGRKLSSKKGSDHKLILFKCDHCRSIIQFPYLLKVLKSSSSSSTCSSEDFFRKVTVKRSVANGKSVPTGVIPVMLKRSNASMDRQSTILEESQSSIGVKKSDVTGRIKTSNQKTSTYKVYNKSEEAILDGRDKSVNTGLVERKKSKNKEKSKRVFPTQGLVEVTLLRRDGTLVEEKKSSKKKNKTPRESGDIPKKHSSWYEESRMPYVITDEVEVKKDRRRDPVKSVCKNTGTSRKELGVSKRAVGTEVYMAKVEGKQRVILMKERSMQTSWGKLPDDGKVSNRSSTASKAVEVSSDMKRSGTAPGSMMSARSTNTHTLLEGSSSHSRRTTASKEVPSITTDQQPKKGLSGIQTEISDLKSQLCRLEAMHNLNHDTAETEITGNNEKTGCQKQPIVVCTSTTYIMTTHSADKKHSKETSRSHSSKSKDSAAEYGLHVESTERRSKRSHGRQLRATESKELSKTKCCDHGNCLGKATNNYQVIGDRITKAVNRLVKCSNRDFLSQYCDGSKSYEHRRLFGGGKNQKRMWVGNGASTGGCSMNFGGSIKSHCQWHWVDFARGKMLEATDSIPRSELVAYRSCSAVFEGRKGELSVSSGNGITVESVRIEGRRSNGYLLKTSISDICEYRNGSVIRLTGKSGWVVLTKKLFLRRLNNGKTNDDFMMHPATTPKHAKSRSAITIKGTDDNTLEPEVSEDMLAEDDLHKESTRLTLSDSSIYLPPTIRDFNAGNSAFFKESEGNATTSGHLSRNLRHRNRGLADRSTNFPDELYLLNCKSAADRTAACGNGSEGDAQCTCRQGTTGSKKRSSFFKRRDTVPVLFEEMMTAPEEFQPGKKPSDVSLKFVFAETLCDKLGSKVFWSSDWGGVKSKNKYIFAVTKTTRTRGSKERLPIREKLKKRKAAWQRHKTNRAGQKSKEHSDQMWEGMPEQDTPAGDSPANPPNKCSCCHCTPEHVCSFRNDKQEEVTGFRRLIRDVGLTGINLNFLKPHLGDRHSHRRGKDSENVQEKEEGGSNNSLKKHEMVYCDCAKQIEELLKKIEPCRPIIPTKKERGRKRSRTKGHVSEEPAEGEEEEEDEDEEEEEEEEDEEEEEEEEQDEEEDEEEPEEESEEEKPKRKVTKETLKKEKGKKVGKVKEAPKEEKEVSTVNTSPMKLITEESSGNKEGKISKASEPMLPQVVNPNMLDNLEEQRRRLLECENLIKEFEMKLQSVSQQNEALACKCDVAVKEVAQKAPTQNELVRDIATQSPNIPVVVKDEAIEAKEIVTETKKSVPKIGSEHSCHSLPSKIELVSERKVCTCQICSNIHYIDKQYLPTSWMKKCKPPTAPISQQRMREEGRGANGDVKSFYYPSDAEKSQSEEMSDKSAKPVECDKNNLICCECSTQENGKQCCKCDSKLRVIEDRLMALEGSQEPRTMWERKRGSEERAASDASSWEHVESETDNETKKKVVTCNNLQFIVGGGPTRRKKCPCTADSPCPFKYLQDEKMQETKNIFFLTNIELLRRWSGLYSTDYQYRRSSSGFWNAHKPIRVHGDWRSVRSTVASFFQKKKYNIFRRRRRESDLVSVNTTIASSVVSFLDDCSRSSMPLRKRSFHLLSEGPRPMRPNRVEGTSTAGDKKKSVKPKG